MRRDVIEKFSEKAQFDQVAFKVQPDSKHEACPTR